MKNNDNDLINFIRTVNHCANGYERENTPLKKLYLIKNISKIDYVFSQVPGNHGCFGTGYPFYAIKSNFNGGIPQIDEQFRYDNELLEEAIKSKLTIWKCRGCLSRNYKEMPDLKQICNPCPKMDNTLKPRKVINRLPDIDMWLVCEDGHVEDSEQVLLRLFWENDLHSSDTDPIQTIMDVRKITDDLKNGIIPDISLPIDLHIIEYSKLKELICRVPEEISSSLENHQRPYIPIHPRSYRKQWQYDDEAYNFVHDFLFSFTDFNFKSSLENTLNSSRKKLAQTYSSDQLFDILKSIMGKSTIRRIESTPYLKEVFSERIESWSHLNVENELSPIEEDVDL